MADQFIAQIEAKLETTNLENEIQSLVPKNKIKIDVDTKYIQNQIQSAINGTKITFSPKITSSKSSGIIASLNNGTYEKQIASLKASIASINDVTKRSGLNSFISELERLQNEMNISAGTNMFDALESSATQFNTVLKTANNQVSIYKNNLSEMSSIFKQSTDDLNTYREMLSVQKEISSLTIKQVGLDQNSQQYQELTTQIKNLETEYSNLESTLTQPLSAEQLEKLKTVSEETSEKIKLLVSQKFDSSYSANFNKITSSFNSLKDKTEDTTAAMERYQTAASGMKTDLASGDVDAIKTAWTEYGTALDGITTKLQQQQTLTASTTLSNNIKAWMQDNTSSAKQFQAQLQELINQLNENTDPTVLKNVSARFKEIQSEAKAASASTNTFASSLKSTALQVLGLSSGVMVIRKIISEIQEAVDTVVELDDALVDLQKTADASSYELSSFYEDANDIAKEYGATTQEIIQSAADWSRLGYSLDDSETMSKLSSMFSSISPGMDVDTSTTGLVSIMKAYGIEAEDALDGIISKINAVGNTAATSNQEIIEGLQNSAAAMAIVGDSLDETIALFTAAQEITQDSTKVGNALRTIAMRIRGKSSLPPYTVMYMRCA